MRIAHLRAYRIGFIHTYYTLYLPRQLDVDVETLGLRASAELRLRDDRLTPNLNAHRLA
jgi:hypothetical protein